MPRTNAKLSFSGAVAGAGLALFALYVVSHAVPIAMVGWPRIAIGALGLLLWIGGGLWWRGLASRGPEPPS